MSAPSSKELQTLISQLDTLAGSISPSVLGQYGLEISAATILADGIPISVKLVGGNWEWKPNLPLSQNVFVVSLHFRRSSSMKLSEPMTPTGSSSTSSTTPPKTPTPSDAFAELVNPLYPVITVSSEASAQQAKTSKSSITVAIPTEVEPYAEDLRRFIDAMVYKLRVHHRKGRWDGKTVEEYMPLLQGEVEELEDAIGMNNMLEIITEAADVANMALIISAIAIERGK